MERLTLAQVRDEIAEASKYGGDITKRTLDAWHEALSSRDAIAAYDADGIAARAAFALKFGRESTPGTAVKDTAGKALDSGAYGMLDAQADIRATWEGIDGRIACEGDPAVRANLAPFDVQAEGWLLLLKRAYGYLTSDSCETQKALDASLARERVYKRQIERLEAYTAPVAHRDGKHAAGELAAYWEGYRAAQIDGAAPTATKATFAVDSWYRWIDDNGRPRAVRRDDIKRLVDVSPGTAGTSYPGTALMTADGLTLGVVPKPLDDVYKELN